MMISSECRNSADRRSSMALLGQVISSIFARMAGPISAFILALILAKYLGSESMGVIFVALTLLHVLGLVARLGMDTALLRFIGASPEEHRAKGYYLTAVRVSFGVSLVIAATILLCAKSIARYILGDSEALGVIYVVACAIPAFSLLGINASVMKAMGYPVRGGFYEVSLWPLATLTLVCVAMISTILTEQLVMFLYLGGIVVSMSLSWKSSSKLLPRSVVARSVSCRGLLSSSVPLAGVELLNFALLGAPLLMLPILADINQAGLYSVSQRLAAQIGLLMTVLAAITAPRFASLYVRNNLHELTNLAANTTRLLFVLSLLPSLVIMVWAEDILMIFGVEFLQAKWGLQILIVGFFLKHALGPVGYILAMTGHEKDLHRISCLSLLILAACSVVLIPQMGATGAALSTTIAMLFQAFTANFMVTRRLDTPMFLLFAREKENTHEY